MRYWMWREGAEGYGREGVFSGMAAAAEGAGLEALQRGVEGGVEIEGVAAAVAILGTQALIL